MDWVNIYIVALIIGYRLTSHLSPLKAHFSRLIAHGSSLTSHRSSLIAHSSSLSEWIAHSEVEA